MMYLPLPPLHQLLHLLFLSYLPFSPVSLCPSVSPFSPSISPCLFPSSLHFPVSPQSLATLQTSFGRQQSRRSQWPLTSDGDKCSHPARWDGQQPPTRAPSPRPADGADGFPGGAPIAAQTASPAPMSLGAAVACWRFLTGRGTDGCGYTFSRCALELDLVT